MTRGCRMPAPAGPARAGSIPLDVLDAEEIAGLLAAAAAVTGELAGDAANESACAAITADWRDLTGLHIHLTLAAAGLDEAIGEHSGILRP